MRLPALAQALGVAALLSAGPLRSAEQSSQELAAARVELAEHLPDLAAQRLQRYLAQKPAPAASEQEEARLLLAEAYLRAGKPEQTLSTLAKFSSPPAQAHYWQGLAHSFLREYDEALQAFKKVPADSESFPLTLFNSLELQLSLNQKDEANETLAQLRKVAPDFRKNERNLLAAQLLLAQDDPESAREILEQASTPKTLERELLLGRIELRAGRHQEAILAFEGLLSQKTSAETRTLALLGKSDALQAKKENAAALELLLSLLAQEEKLSQDLLAARLERLFTSAGNPDELRPLLQEFAQPSTLGEDGNLASPQKLLANYYLSRISNEERRQELLAQIIALAPTGEITARAHLDLAELSFLAEDQADFLTQLQAAQQAAPSTPPALLATDLLARAATQQGDLAQAKELFAQAAQHPNATFAERALLNQAILQVFSKPEVPLSTLAPSLDSEQARNTLQLAKAVSLAQSKDPKAREALLTFIELHPEHPDLARARLALAELLLTEATPDFELIEVQLASLPDSLARIESQLAFRLSHRLAVITKDWASAVARGEQHLKNFAEAEEEPYFLLRLAESCLNNRDLHRAHSLFIKTAALSNAGELAEIARYFGAKANLGIPTPEATSEALLTLDGIIKRSGPLATKARLLKARTLLKEEGQATACLATLEGIPGNPGDQPEAALLTAQAYRELGAQDPAGYERAVRLYQLLIEDERTGLRFSNQLHYLLALTHEESGRPDLAIEPLVRVVNRENRAPTDAEEEWEFYYQCGFKAIDILLEADRAKAAHTLARKLALTKGPQAEKAATRAEQIQLDHLLWTD